MISSSQEIFVRWHRSVYEHCSFFAIFAAAYEMVVDNIRVRLTGIRNTWHLFAGVADYAISVA